MWDNVTVIAPTPRPLFNESQGRAEALRVINLKTNCTPVTVRGAINHYDFTPYTFDDGDEIFYL